MVSSRISGRPLVPVPAINTERSAILGWRLNANSRRLGTPSPSGSAVEPEIWVLLNSVGEKKRLLQELNVSVTVSVAALLVCETGPVMVLGATSVQVTTQL